LHLLFPEVVDFMLEFNRLRIDQGDGSAAIDYRIEAGRIESRAVQNGVEKPWQRLTPEDVRHHVMADTMLARWLRRRMGIHQLIRACQPDSSVFGGSESPIEADPAAA
jgi:hypothetical protein